MFFKYDSLAFRYEPFPIGLAKPVMDEGLYGELVASYPEKEHFVYLPKIGHKYTLSERFNPKDYASFIKSNNTWRKFHQWIKSDKFIFEVLSTLKEHFLDLGYADRAGDTPLFKTLYDRVRRRHRLDTAKLTSRFEFSMLPADGGSVIPHTDSPSKIVTLVVSIVQDGEWVPSFGGGTDVNRPVDTRHSFNRLNKQLSFEEMEVIDTFDFTPNQAVIFVKTFNSWHSVRPMSGEGSDAMRRTLTINIESR